MFNRVSPSIQRHLRVCVLALFACATLGSLNGLAVPANFLMNFPLSTPSEEEPGGSEREGAEQAGSLCPPGSSQRRTLPRHVIFPSHRTSATLWHPVFPQRACFSADPARQLIASGAGLFQRC